MHAQVDQEKCISSGQCVMNVPAVFDQRDDDGVLILRINRPPTECQDNVRRAALMCPARAITLSEE